MQLEFTFQCIRKKVSTHHFKVLHMQLLQDYVINMLPFQTFLAGSRCIKATDRSNPAVCCFCEYFGALGLPRLMTRKECIASIAMETPQTKSSTASDAAAVPQTGTARPWVKGKGRKWLRAARGCGRLSSTSLPVQVGITYTVLYQIHFFFFLKKNMFSRVVYNTTANKKVMKYTVSLSRVNMGIVHTNYFIPLGYWLHWYSFHW